MLLSASLHTALHPVLRQVAVPDVQQSSLAEDLKRQGNQMMRENQFAAARDLYSRAITVSPEVGQYYCNRCVLCALLAGLKLCTDVWRVTFWHVQLFVEKLLSSSEYF